jgi:hypothetical protein
MRYVTVAIAVASGLIVLLGYLYPLDALVEARAMLTNWAVLVAAMAVLVGVGNLTLVHMEKIRNREKNSVYGLVLIASLLITFVVGLALGPSDQLMQFAMDAIIVPVEASLMGILAVTLVYASIRLLRRRADAMTVIFLVVALLFLIAALPTPLDPGLTDPLSFLILGFLRLFSDGGARGLLIGIALGALLTSLRVLFGIDRPYGGN